MNRQSQEHTTLQNQVTESEVNKDGLPTNGLHGFMMRHMGHQDATHSNNARKKPIPIIPILLVIMVALHIFAAIFLAKTGSTAFLVNSPMTYGMIGLLVIFVIVKLKYVFGVMRGKGKQPPQKTMDEISRVQHE
jgi:hypothetical protein